MKVLDDTLELLRDGEWHTIPEIQKLTGLTHFKAECLVHFLISYNFVSYAPTAPTSAPPCLIPKIRMKPDIIDFFNILEKLEEDAKHLERI